MTENSLIKFSELRPTIQIHLPDGRIIEGARGATTGEFLSILAPDDTPLIVGALVNNQLRELTFTIDMDAHVRPVTMRDEDGMRIYRRTLTFLLEIAITEVFPGGTLTIDHSVAAGGYYCSIAGLAEALSPAGLKKIETRMHQLVDQNIPITKESVPIKEVIDYFKARGADDKVRLLHHRKKDFLVLYRIGNHADYHHGYKLPATGYLKWFALEPMDGGFTLRFPRRGSPTQLSKPIRYPKMLAEFRRYGALLKRLDIESVGALNDAILAGRAKKIILVSEALHHQRLATIAARIADNQDKIGIILIAGPSSSGKTTSSRRLTIHLLSYGISPYPLEMDNYFVSRDKTPLDEDGEYDFESLYALDLKQLSADLKKLTAGEKVTLPKFDFHTGAPGIGDTVQLVPGQIVIMEGIHGLNPGLLPDFPTDKMFRIYISALTQLNLDRHNRVSTTDTRLLRRIVRDDRDRGYNASETISRWESVTRGEKRNIFPYQENADEMFNSALVYELAALKPVAEPLLRQVSYGTPEHVEAKRLLALLEWVLPIEPDLVPDHSLLKEFLGGSILKDFKAWD